MAVAIINNLFCVYTPTTQLRSSYLCSLRHSTRLFRRASSASSQAFLDPKSTDAVKLDKEANRSKNLLACPICYDSLTWTGDPAFSMLPLVSFLYERGWRQTFSVWGGFPGPEKEFELMKDFLKPVFGGNIIDASCASGLFSRLFAKSGLFSSVAALDFSENMLQQCYEFTKQEENFPKGADISRLPFVSSSVDAVHAGAAIHCWPSPSAAVAEISRVLRPGGVFVATTYILDGPFSFVPFLRELRQNIRQVSGSFITLSERELEDLCTGCGLVRFSCIRNGPFVMFSAAKPN
ncbi:uncharacterized methyltransferase At1g78140, chloroplastic isoform X2 [Neltuma alba]|uniref:uncharacterized methyltransferase At1g78140, chloroplastic isoform X2 n=1 Tax=Neltuma alba TaxID=207710 RepID=UPI0010A30114|nr:uncharacterized methyltransferase At1g78140, chloroplastic-like isoform X2 [Prosopis alba]